MNYTNHLFICLLSLIITNVVWCYYRDRRREGLSLKSISRTLKKMNPAKIIEDTLGKVAGVIDEFLGGIIDTLLRGVPGLRFVYQKVKKKKGLIDKIGTTFRELFIGLMSMIFTPLAAIIVLYMSFMVFSYLLIPSLKIVFSYKIKVPQDTYKIKVPQDTYKIKVPQDTYKIKSL